MVWSYDGPHSPTMFGNIVKKYLGVEGEISVNRFLSMYNELLSKKSPQEILEHFYMDGQPIFTPEQSESIYKAIHTQSGGSVIDNIGNSVVDTITGQGGPPNPAIQKTIETIQLFIRQMLPYVFILQTLEYSPLFGDLIGAALDVAAATLPVIATAIQNQTPAIVGLIPLPYAGTIGIVLGWLFSFFFLWIAMVIGVSRRDFSSAVEATAGMIPFVGGTAMKVVSAADRVSTKLLQRYAKIMNSAAVFKDTLLRSVEGSPLQKTLQNIKITGGKRFTRRKVYKNKWKKTQRKLKRL